MRKGLLVCLTTTLAPMLATAQSAQQIAGGTDPPSITSTKTNSNSAAPTGVAGTPTTPAACTTSPSSDSSSGGTMLGGYIGSPGDSGSPWQRDLSGMQQVMGQAPSIVDVYVEQNDWNGMAGQAESSAQQLQSSVPSIIPDVAIPMATAADGSADQAFQDIANGAHDATFEAIFRAYAAVSKNIIIRPGWEMNGGWYPWTVMPQNASDFIAAFDHIANLAHAFTGAHIRVVWNPGAAGTTVDYKQMYPGNQAVDRIGIDMYSQNAVGTPTDQSLSTSGYSLTTAAHMAVANGKPLAIEETGAAPSDTTDFVKNMVQAIQSVPGVRISNVNIWNDPSGSSNSSLLFSSDPTASQAWQQAFNQIAGISAARSCNVTANNTRSGSSRAGR